MKHINKLAIFGIILLSLSACEGTKKQLGLTRSTPDEYAVIKRAPLEMPPNYSLRPPEPGATRPQESAPDEKAQSTIFGSNATQSHSNVTLADGESALLQKAGAGGAQTGIREQVDRETAALEPKEKPVAEKLLGWSKGGSSTPPATVVDAKAEAERLKKNSEEGKAITEGETPSIEE